MEKKVVVEFKDKIKFGDLSGWLKSAVIIAWVMGGFYITVFVIGFLMGLRGST